jgi:hypothetical protein
MDMANGGWEGLFQFSLSQFTNDPVISWPNQLWKSVFGYTLWDYTLRKIEVAQLRKALFFSATIVSLRLRLYACWAQLIDFRQTCRWIETSYLHGRPDQSWDKEIKLNIFLYIWVNELCTRDTQDNGGCLRKEGRTNNDTTVQHQCPGPCCFQNNNVINTATRVGM